MYRNDLKLKANFALRIVVASFFEVREKDITESLTLLRLLKRSRETL